MENQVILTIQYNDKWKQKSKNTYRNSFFLSYYDLIWPKLWTGQSVEYFLFVLKVLCSTQGSAMIWYSLPDLSMQLTSFAFYPLATQIFRQLTQNTLQEHTQKCWCVNACFFFCPKHNVCMCNSEWVGLPWYNKLATILWQLSWSHLVITTPCHDHTYAWQTASPSTWMQHIRRLFDELWGHKFTSLVTKRSVAAHQASPTVSREYHSPWYSMATLRNAMDFYSSANST